MPAAAEADDDDEAGGGGGCGRRQTANAAGTSLTFCSNSFLNSLAVVVVVVVAVVVSRESFSAAFSVVVVVDSPATTSCFERKEAGKVINSEAAAVAFDVIVAGKGLFNGVEFSLRSLSFTSLMAFITLLSTLSMARDFSFSPKTSMAMS